MKICKTDAPLIFFAVLSCKSSAFTRSHDLLGAITRGHTEAPWVFDPIWGLIFWRSGFICRLYRRTKDLRRLVILAIPSCHGSRSQQRRWSALAWCAQETRTSSGAISTVETSPFSRASRAMAFGLIVHELTTIAASTGRFQSLAARLNSVGGATAKRIQAA